MIRSNKIYRIDKNLYVCGIRHFGGVDDLREGYKFKKLEENPRFKEIWIEYNTGFNSGSSLIPINLIDRFEGFEDDEHDYGKDWYLCICAASQFLDDDVDNSIKRYSGPDMNWFRDAALWWQENEPTYPYILVWLVTNYVKLFMYSHKEFNNTFCRHSIYEPNGDIIKYLLDKHDVNWILDYLDNTDIFKLFYILYHTRTYDLLNNERFASRLDNISYKEKYDVNMHVIELLEGELSR